MSPDVVINLSSVEALQSIEAYRHKREIADDQEFGKNFEVITGPNGAPALEVDLGDPSSPAFFLPASENLPPDSFSLKLNIRWPESISPLGIVRTQGARVMNLAIRGQELVFEWSIPPTRQERNLRQREIASGANESSADSTGLLQQLAAKAPLGKTGLTAGSWHEVVIAVEADLARVFIDGKEVISLPGVSLAVGWEPRHRRQSPDPRGTIAFIFPNRDSRGTVQISGIEIFRGVPQKTADPAPADSPTGEPAL